MRAQDQEICRTLQCDLGLCHWLISAQNLLSRATALRMTQYCFYSCISGLQVHSTGSRSTERDMFRLRNGVHHVLDVHMYLNNSLQGITCSH